MKTTIYLVRHGEVENPEKLIYGRLPRFILSERGRSQVGKLAKYFRAIKLDAVYASPLLRSRQTAKCILTYQPKLKIHYSKKLLEIDNKIWEGIVWTKRDPKLVKKYRDTPAKIKTNGLESAIDLAKRMSEKINQIIKKHKGGKIAIFSHADSIRAATLHYESKNLDQLHERICTNASITTLVFNGGKLIKSSYKEIHPRAEESFWTKTKKELA